MSLFSILAGKQITYEMIYEAIQLDRISYDDIYQLQVETCYDYFERNNDIYIMALDNGSGHIIGYINFSPVKEDVFKNLISGNVIDPIISGDDLLPYLDGNFYYGYFSSIVVHPNYRHHGVATQMLQHWSKLVFRLAAEHDVYFSKIVADAVSNVGVHLLSKLGFSFIRSSTHESKIMTLDLFESHKFNPKFSKKLTAVNKKYSEKKGENDAVQI